MNSMFSIKAHCATVKPDYKHISDVSSCLFFHLSSEAAMLCLRGRIHHLLIGAISAPSQGRFWKQHGTNRLQEGPEDLMLLFSRARHSRWSLRVKLTPGCWWIRRWKSHWLWTKTHRLSVMSHVSCTARFNLNNEFCFKQNTVIWRLNDC